MTNRNDEWRVTGETLKSAGPRLGKLWLAMLATIFAVGIGVAIATGDDSGDNTAAITLAIIVPILLAFVLALVLVTVRSKRDARKRIGDESDS